MAIGLMEYVGAVEQIPPAEENTGVGTVLLFSNEGIPGAIQTALDTLAAQQAGNGPGPKFNSYVQ